MSFGIIHSSKASVYTHRAILTVLARAKVLAMPRSKDAMSSFTMTVKVPSLRTGILALWRSASELGIVNLGMASEPVSVTFNLKLYQGSFKPT
jgi:hypothetical protein